VTNANGSILVVSGNELDDVDDVLLSGRSQPKRCHQKPV
jgi:hypothetical protein